MADTEKQAAAPASEGLTEEAATARIMGLLGEDEPDETEEQPTAKKAAKAAPTLDADEEPAEEDETEASDDDDASDDDAPDDDDDDAEDAPDEPTRYKVKIGDEEQEVTLEELTKGYLRQADYTRKTQAHAAERKKFEQEELPAVKQERQQIAEKLALVEQILQAQAPAEPDWAALRAEDPQAYAVARADWQAIKEQQEAIAAERQAAMEKVQRDQADALQKHLDAERGKLMAAIPEWSDAEVAKKDRAALVETAHGLGFTDEEIGQVLDHRVFLLLRKAAAYDRLQAEKPAVAQKIQQVKAATPGAAGSAKRGRPTEVERARSRFRQTGSAEDAALVLERLINAGG